MNFSLRIVGRLFAVFSLAMIGWETPGVTAVDNENGSNVREVSLSAAIEIAERIGDPILVYVYDSI